MLFFPKELQDGIQDKSGWPRKAMANLKRNDVLYKKYFKLIRPFLPASALAFTRYSYHDCQVARIQWQKDRLLLVLDRQYEEMPFPQRFIHLTFTGMRQRPDALPKKGEWWNWEEFHLAARTKFQLHILFTETESVISADEIRLKLKNTLS